MGTVSRTLRRIDVRIFYLFNVRLRCRFMSLLMRFATNLGEFSFCCLYLVSILILGNYELRFLALYTVFNIISGHCIVQSIKRIVNRRRPYVSLHFAVPEKVTACRYSFPSGHTCTAFCLSFPIFFMHLHNLQFRSMSFFNMQSNYMTLDHIIFSNGFIIAAFALSLLVGISRMYLGAHYPTDVICGILASLISSIFVINFIPLLRLINFLALLLCKKINIG